MISKKVLICSNYAWTIYNFRMPLIRNLKKQGYDVIVVTQFDGYEEVILREVDEIHNLLILAAELEVKLENYLPIYLN